MDNNTWHVLPTNDLKPHKETGINCPCNPVIERNENDDGWIVIHRSYDRREQNEEGALTKNIED